MFFSPRVIARIHVDPESHLQSVSLGIWSQGYSRRSVFRIKSPDVIKSLLSNSRKIIFEYNVDGGFIVAVILWMVKWTPVNSNYVVVCKLLNKLDNLIKMFNEAVCTLVNLCTLTPSPDL